MFRSALAILGGLITLTVVSFGIEAAVATLVASTGGPWFQVGMTAYTLLSVTLGGYITAWIAPRAPVGHATLMGAIELLFTASAMVQFGATGRIAAWLPGMLLMIPAAAAGGMIRARWTAHAATTAEIR